MRELLKVLDLRIEHQTKIFLIGFYDFDYLVFLIFFSDFVTTLELWWRD